MNFFKNLFPSARKKRDEDARKQLAESITEALFGLPNKALLAAGARVSSRFLPVVENIAPHSFELQMFRKALNGAEVIAGVSRDPPAPSERFAPPSRLKVWYAANISLVSLHLSQATKLAESKNSSDPPTDRGDVKKHVSESISHAFELSSVLYDDPKMLQAIMTAFHKDCERLRVLTSERGLNDAAPISSEWLGDIWWSEQDAYRELLKAR